MRSYNNLYEPMLQDDYIKQRFINASKKKKNRNDVREVLENLDEHTELLKKMLTEELFIPDYHKPSIINESSSKKTRRILKPHYKYEQVIHHCAIGQFKPIVMNGLYEFSCGSIPGRGVHYGKKYMRKWLDSYDGKKFFVLKMDVHHFFESINRRILKRKLKEVIRDKRFYRLLCILIEHDKIALVAKILTDAGVEIDAEQTKTLVGCIAFDDISGALEILQEIGITGAMFDELKEIIEEMRKGVPLGYFTSQWFGNFYLKALDHYIKEEADCSSGVAAIVKGAGYRLGIDALKKVSTACYTGNLRAALKAAGFEVLTENKYLTSDAYLLAGDILLNDGAHTATNLTDGAKSSGAGASNTTPVKSNTKVDVAHGFDKSLAGTYKVTASGLNLRAGAGTGKSILAVMENGEKVQCYGYYNDHNGVKWLYVVYKNIVGYASSKYLSK